MRRVLLVTLAAVALAGCGGGATATTSSTPSPAPSPSASANPYTTYLGLVKGFTPTYSNQTLVESQADELCNKGLANLQARVAAYFDKPDAEVEVKTDSALIDAYCPGQSAALSGAVAGLRGVRAAASASAAAAASAAADAAFTDPANYKVGIVITKQSCFGSAGCNVTYHIDPSYTGPGVMTGDYSVTYQVLGLEDPQINTFTITGGTAHFDGSESGSTASTRVNLTAKITAIRTG